MNWIHWNAVLETGHPILDTDHEQLVVLINRLTASVKAREGKAACLDLLDKIISQAKVHFAFEEQLMAEQQYPHAARHAAEHTRLLKQAIRFMVKFEADSSASHIPVIHFPEDWLTTHIVTADREFAVFLGAAV